MPESIIQIMETLNYSKTESLCYITLLQEGPLSGYQIAKKIGLSRSSVYNALETIYKKGAVTLIQGDTNLYQAVSYDEFMRKVRLDFETNTKSLEQELAKISNEQSYEKYHNIEGRENVISKCREMILTAKEEVLVNTDLSPFIFEDEIRYAAGKGVRIIFFSFCKKDIGDLPIEVYSHNHFTEKASKYSRIMMAVDDKKTLLASSTEIKPLSGTYTENELLIAIVCEHIHHDIYLLALQRPPYEMNIHDKLSIGTCFEERAARRMKE